MGIAPYKTFTFDGESSGYYGVYITGTGVFNAPERSVEMVEIAGRNGSFALDKGKFENIEVTYKVGIVDDSEADFADRVSDFRNWLCSKVGYCRLEDEYNPNEYRMAVYASGMELEHDLLIAGEAEITFNCKPQRWLTSGETAITVTSGDTVTNPTLFEAKPLLQVWGFGNINFGEDTIEIISSYIGDIVVAQGKFVKNVSVSSIDFDDAFANIGDTITVNYARTFSQMQVSGATISNYTYNTSGSGSATVQPSGQYALNVTNELTISPFLYGTTNSISASVTVNISKSNGTTAQYVTTATLDYDGANTITLTYARTTTNVIVPTTQNTTGDVVLNSTQTAIGAPIYIDLDIGEAYKFEDDSVVSVNNAVSLGSDLPKLPTGQTTINYDNTITSFKVAPRWWKV